MLSVTVHVCMLLLLQLHTPSGGFSTVKLGRRRSDGMEVAVKIMKKKNLKPEDLKIAEEEVKILSQIEHPNCVRMVAMYEDKKKIYIIMEKLAGGELFDRIVEKEKFSEAEAANCFRQVTLAVHYLHSVNIVHRDLKPENLMYDGPGDNATLKITDFGLGKVRVDEHTLMQTPCGTPHYVAPEVLAPAKIRQYDQSCDMWSIGVILYVMLCGFPPFYDETLPKLYKRIRHARFSFPSPYWDTISDNAKDLVKKLLVVDPTKRLSATEALDHPWLQGTAPTTEFGSGYQKRLRKRNARERLQQGIRMLMALHRFSNLIESPSAQPADEQESTSAAADA
jgi:calcium/calmodulin-dependent protein kinase I